jgi:Na+-transporting methylmalonyl-CoA/oxaloacetate decarboxylase beta subunit
MREQEPHGDGAEPQKATVMHKIGALIAGVLAVKVVAYFVTTMWRLVTREDPPQVDQKAPLAKKAAWVALIGAATGATRQTVRDMILPPSEGPV